MTHHSGDVDSSAKGVDGYSRTFGERTGRPRNFHFTQFRISSRPRLQWPSPRERSGWSCSYCCFSASVHIRLLDCTGATDQFQRRRYGTKSPVCPLIFHPDQSPSCQGAGMTVFKNLYILNHTIYIVTTDPRSVPERRWILSKGKVLNPKEPNEPDEQTLAVIAPIEAKLLFGSVASVMDGVSVSSIIILSFLARLTRCSSSFKPTALNSWTTCIISS
jgi:hypothetical protein